MRWVEVRYVPGLVDDGVVVLLYDIGRERQVSIAASLLRRVTELANAGTDLEEATRRAAGDVRSTLGWQAGHVLHVGEDGELVDLGVWDVEDGFEAVARAVGDVAPAGGVAAAAVARAEPVTSEDVAESPTLARVVDAGVRTVVAVPVIADGQVVRVLELFARDPVDLDDDQRSLLTEVGRQLGSVAVRERYVEQLERSHTELARSNAELERFAYVASHDLQEPLRKIVGFSELLQLHEGPWGEEQVEYLQYVVHSAGRLQRLIKDLLAYARAGRRELRQDPVDLDRVTADVVADLSYPLEEAGGTIEVGPLPVVTGDEGQLREVVQNLLSNALKYRDEQRPIAITVTSRSDGDEAHVVVADNGIGIAEEFRDSVFEVFRRLHPAHHYEGTGLGLALVHRIVERHGGSVRLHDTATGEGVAVHLHLPTRQEQP